MLFVKLLILLTTVQHALSDEGFCSPNVTGTQHITLTVRNETILNPPIHSPNYPDSYPNNIDCIWKITVPSGKRVKLTFTQMVLEVYVYSSACNDDYVELRSGLNSYSSWIGKYCGSFPPSAQYSSGRYMWVKFHSDGGVTRTGFSAIFEAVDYGENPDNHGSCSPNVTGYQYITLTGSSGTIQSPNYPNSYPNNMDCVWKITVPYGKEVNLTFTHMSLQYMYSCTADFVELRDGLTSYSSKIGSYCGSSLPLPKHSNGRYMLVRFHSDGNVTNAGFTANFEALDSARYTDNSNSGTGGRGGSSSVSVGGSVSGTIIFIIVVCVCCACCCRRRKRKKPRVIVHEVVTQAPAASPNVIVLSNVNVNQQQVAAPLPRPQQQHPQAVVNPAYNPAAYLAPSPHGSAYPPPPLGSAYSQPPQGYTYPPPPRGSAYPSAPPGPAAYPPTPQGAYAPSPSQGAPPPPYTAAPQKQ